MSKRLPPQTPTRRSRRFQPLATPLTTQNARFECNWDGGSILTRACVILDLTVEEIEQRRTERKLKPEDTLDLTTEETLFYPSFTTKKPKAKQPRGKQPAEETVTYRPGDVILVETGTLYRQKKPPSVAVIVSMWEVRKKEEGAPRGHDSSNMRVRVHWFLRPTELPAHRHEKDISEHEIYYSLDSCDILQPSVIVSHCSVSSHLAPIPTAKGKGVLKPTKTKRSPKKKGSSSTAPDEETDSGDEEADVLTPEPSHQTFYCRLAINSPRGLYYDFNWDKHYRDALKTALLIPEEEEARAGFGAGLHWDVNTPEPKKRTKKTGPPPKKRAKLDTGDDASEDVDSGSEAEIESESEDEDEEVDGAEESENPEEDEEEDSMLPGTPSRSRKRKRGQAAPKTPRKTRNTNLAQPTPHSKAALRQRKKLKKAANATPRKRRATGFVIRPPTLSFNADMRHLPKDPWLRAMHVLHVGNRPDALPCRGEEYERVLLCVGDLLEEGSGGCVYISGVPGTGKTATVHTVVRELKRMAESNEISPFTYVEINGLRIPDPSVAYTLLWEAIARDANPTKDPNFRVSSKESSKALNHHFSGRKIGPAAGHAYVVLMDELDQLVTTKQDVIYNFFNWPTLAGSRLVVIAVANTMDLPERVMTGRVRSRLGMTRINFSPYTTAQLEEIVQARLLTSKEGLDETDAKQDVMSKDAVKLAAVRISRITGDARRVLDVCRRVVERVSSTRTIAGPSHVTKILSIMQSSPTAGYLQDCSLHERIMLASLIKCIKREGVEEIKWSDVQYQHLSYIGALTGTEDSQRQPSVAELTMVLDNLVASRAVLLEDGAAVARKPTGERRLLLNIEQIEVERVLSDVGGSTWKNVLST